jgi:hypothetical protein
MTTLIIVLTLIIIDTAATTYIICYFLNNIKKNNEYLHRIEGMPVQINIDADRLVEEVRRELIKQQEKRNAPSRRRLEIGEGEGND